MGKIVTFGEILMRITPLGNKKLRQSNQLEYYFGGTEANVAVSLSQFGNKSEYITAVSDDFLGRAVISYLRQLNVNTEAVIKLDHPLGLYFLEVGAVMRSSKTCYNRAHSAFCNIEPHMVDWNVSLEDCDWFHWTGITPALSENTYLTLKEGIKKAHEKGITISTDSGYRKDMWNYGKDAKDVLHELIKYTTIFIGGVNEINEILETSFEHTNEDFVKASKLIMKTFPNIKKVADKKRSSLNANWHKVISKMWNGTEFIETKELEITHIVDRIGTGDAFAAGLIHGLLHYDDFKALQFGNAACAIKHTIEGDANLLNKADVLSVINGNVSGRIIR